MPWWQTRLYEEGLVHEFTSADVVENQDGQPVKVVPLEEMGITWS